MNLINELRMLAEDLYVNGYSRYSSAMSKAADELECLRTKLEATEKAVTEAYQRGYAIGQEEIETEREALRIVLTDLLNDLEERAKWNLEASQRVVACGNGVYVRAKAALEKSK